MKLISKTIIVSAALLLSLAPVGQVAAVSGGDWRAGRIVDDAAFTNASAMSVPEIQTFLNARVPVCDTWGTQPSEFGGGTRAQYGASHGNPAPFTCLKDYYEVPKTTPGPVEPASNYGGAPIPAGAQSAAQLIANAASKYNISPRVLLVKLATESAGPLTSDDWPFKRQYLYAMGAHCPDSGPGGAANCDSNWAGFSLQMDEAAALLRWYLDSMTQPWWQYKKPYQNNSILWRVVESGCGAGNVYIENKATAALYTYTPYQPNQAALNNLYGTGDGCSSYGNRNFWRVWYDWFGSPLGPDYYAEYSAESAFPTLEHNQKSTVFISYKNAGSQNWYDSATAASQGTQPVVLATMGPLNRCSAFVDVTWNNCSRPTGLFSKVYEQDGVTLAADQHVAKPTQIVEYSFVVSAPDDTYVGTHAEYFAPIREGAPGWSFYMGADNVFLNVNVNNAYRASYSGQSPYPVISQNDRSKAFVKMKNTGSAAWYDITSATQAGKKPVVLATEAPVNRSSVFGASWGNNARPSQTFSKVLEADGATLGSNQHIVQPGQIAEYEFLLTPLQTTNPGVYREYFRVIREGAKTFSVDGSGWYLDVGVRKSSYGAAYVSQSQYPVLPRSTSSNIYFDLRNTGTTIWYDDHAWTPGILTVRLATTWPINRPSTFYDPTWFASSRPKNVFSQVFESDGITPSLDQHAAFPNQVVRYEFPIKAPSSPGTYYEHFQPVIEGSPGSSWDMGGLVWTKITVQ